MRYQLIKVSILQDQYIYFYLQGPMKTPIEIKDEIENVIKEIFSGWNCEDFGSIKKDYIELVEYLQNKNTFSKRVSIMIKNKVENKDKFNIVIIPSNFTEVIEGVRNIFQNPIRYGIFQYANYIDDKYSEEEIEKRKDEIYFLNKTIKVEYTHNISYLRQN